MLSKQLNKSDHHTANLFQLIIKMRQKMVSDAKHANINQRLPSAYSLLKAVENCQENILWGRKILQINTISSLYWQFLIFISNEKLISYLHKISINQEEKDTSTSYPGIYAISKFFAPNRHIQTALEAFKTFTFFIILPLRFELKSQIQCISSGMFFFRHSEIFTSLYWLAKSYMGEIKSININHTWVAASL